MIVAGAKKQSFVVVVVDYFYFYYFVLHAHVPPEYRIKIRLDYSSPMRGRFLQTPSQRGQRSHVIVGRHWCVWCVMMPSFAPTVGSQNIAGAAKGQRRNEMTLIILCILHYCCWCVPPHTPHSFAITKINITRFDIIKFEFEFAFFLSLFFYLFVCGGVYTAAVA